MRGIHRDFRYCFGVAALALAAIWVTCALAFPQNSTAQGNKAASSKESVFTQVVKALPPGGAPPRMSDGHVDLIWTLLSKQRWKNAGFRHSG